jgi:isopenicillin N synthase-like dioxygenase
VTDTEQTMTSPIPLIEPSPLFGGPCQERDEIDRLLADAAQTSGFCMLAGPSEHVPTFTGNLESMLRVFDLPSHQQRALWRQFYAPDHPNVYRGWNPRDGEVGVDIYDMGPDVAYPRSTSHDPESPTGTDPLLGATPVPDADTLPGWNDAVSSYYRSMEHLGAAVMRSVARILGLEETFFESSFHGGISTLRLLRYQRPPFDPTDESDEPDMPRRGEHVDSGFVTLLCQHGVAGLSAKMRNGDWIDVPPTPGHVAVNFGGLLERWTGGLFRATPHRVVSHGITRFSVPFFYEPSPPQSFGRSRLRARHRLNPSPTATTCGLQCVSSRTSPASPIFASQPGSWRPRPKQNGPQTKQAPRRAPELN